jgi:hypothetical protein
VVRLTEVFRQAAQNAHRINEGLMPDLAVPKADLLLFRL